MSDQHRGKKRYFSFDVSMKDDAFIKLIAERAFADGLISSGEEQDLRMDLTAVHANGHPLRLKDLLVADDFNFAHDVGGIRRHLNRNEPIGELFSNHFLPRFRAKEAA